MFSPSLFRVPLGMIVGCLCLACQGHDGPEHEIDELTEQMKVQGETPDLLIQRAIEYNVLGKHAEAARDLERALEIEDSSVTARRQLSQAYFSLGKTNEALATVSRALRASDDPGEEAVLLMIRAGFLRVRREYGKALDDANEALRLYPQNAEWFLARSQLQAVLSQRHERVKGLEEGIRETGSGLLTAEWVDALLEDGQVEQALARIERELRESRWKAAWLIRRARARLAMDQRQAAVADLTAALDELNHRLSASSTDALLLADRAQAYELLGKREEARRDYRAARDKGLTEEWVRERLRALRSSPKDEE